MKSRTTDGIGTNPQPKSLAPKPPKKSFLTVNVSVKDTELFKHVVKVLGEFCIDERVPEAIRMEYVGKVMRHDNALDQETNC